MVLRRLSNLQRERYSVKPFVSGVVSSLGMQRGLTLTKGCHASATGGRAYWGIPGCDYAPAFPWDPYLGYAPGMLCQPTCSLRPYLGHSLGDDEAKAKHDLGYLQRDRPSFRFLLSLTVARSGPGIAVYGNA